jgi:hypothetical protein
MNTTTGRGSWSPAPSQPHTSSTSARDDDDDDDDASSHAAPLPVAAAKENMRPDRTGKDPKVAQTVASQLLCELALELD